ncbi:MAG: hypothetical protein LBT74_06680 [Acidobacteriota bacterium]|jgi:signal transduction histidine kinase|nr:hypothetical protein [Acidobacteriota bacterium]
MTVACLTKWLAATLSADALITSVSAGAGPLTGFSPQELVGCPVINILEDDSAFTMPRILSEVAENGFWEGELVHRTRSGERLPADGMVSSLTGLGRPGYLLVSNLGGVQADVEGDLSAVEAVATTLRGYAHDLNNPLTVVMGFTQLLMLNEACTGKVKTDLEKVLAGLQQVVELVDDMHRYAYSLYKSPKPPLPIR